MINIKDVDESSTTDTWLCQICTYHNLISAYPTCILCNKTDPQLTEYNITDTSSNLINTSESLTTSTSLTVRDRQYNDEKNAEKLFHNIISYCQKNNIHFVDDQFPPLSRSIGNDNHSYQWLKISEISSSSIIDNFLNWSVYSSPEPSDIQQGSLGDCWLMAALALITERPKMLEHIVLTKTVNEQGIYLIRLCHNGLWKTIIVDDCFPCTKSKQLAYTQANCRQLYVPLIEKACAKLFGSYADLYGGTTEEGLQLLTGAPCDHIYLQSNNYILDSNIVWAKLLSACESQLLISAETGRIDINEEEYKSVHIHPNHAFSILAAYFLSHIPMQFVLVRDPHAKMKYREELITSSILMQLNSILPFYLPSGAFWISWPIFLKYFHSITISTYVNDYYDMREIAQFTQSSTEQISTYYIHVPETSLVNISLIYHRENRRSNVYHTQSFILCDIDNKSSKDIATNVAILQTNRGTFTYWSGLLKAGSYILIPFSTSFWDEKNHKSKRDFTLVIHSNIQIDVKVIYEPATLLADCLIAIILKESSKISPETDFNYYLSTEKYHFVIYIAENLSLNKYLNIDTDMSDGINVRNSRQSFITHDCIPPHHRQIIFLTEWTHEQDQIANMNYVYQILHVVQPNDSVPLIDISKNDFHSYRSF